MASGLPDYFHGVRPLYGTCKQLVGGMIVPANLITKLRSITGKGIIYGGNAHIDYTSTQKTSLFYIVIDGMGMIAYAFSQLHLFGLTLPGLSMTYLLRFDDTDYRYTVGLTPGITFDKSFDLYFSESHGTTPTIDYEVDYALIT